MATNARNAILKALIDGVVTELMIKTIGTQVYIDDTTTISAKIAEIVTAINARAKIEDVNKLVSDSINDLRQEFLGDLPVEAYNTFAELAKYIEEHEDATELLTNAIGNKADAGTVATIKATVDALGSLARKSTVSESDLDTALKEKINAAAQGNHSHSNKSVLDGITATKIAGWDAKSNVYVSSSQPSSLTVNDIWIQI